MTIVQTIEITADRRIFLDLPPELPIGKAKITVTSIDARNIDSEDPDDELFGIWKNRRDMENVDQYIRDIRKGRKFDN